MGGFVFSSYSEDVGTFLISVVRYLRLPERLNMYYKGTIAALRAAIQEIQPGTQAEYLDLVPGNVVPLSYLLWMCEEVQKMDISSVDESAKAGRWMGWVFAHVELAGVWDNTKTRDLVRDDRRNGYDKPHQE